MRSDRRSFLRFLGAALAFAVGRPARARPRPGALEVHSATRNTVRGAIGAGLRRFATGPSSFKTYPGTEAMALPLASAAGTPRSLARVVRASEHDAGFSDAPLELAELGRLLHLTNGVTGRRRATLLRAAPSAGALYAGEVYVLAERVSGLAPGAYHYAVPDHALVRLRSGSFAGDVAGALERPALVANAAAIVLLSNVFRRYTARYANRGYRYALIDSGHIGENLCLGALSLGLRERAPLRFQDERLNALLGLDGRTEAVCALHLVGRPAPTAAPTAPLVRRLVEQGTAPARPLPGRAIERYHAATRLVEGDTPNEALEAPALQTTPPGLTLPATPSPGMTVGACIDERRSAMHFREEPISLEQLSFVLEMADGHAPLRRAPGVELHVVAHRVADLTPGLYRYESEAHGLTAVRSGNLSGPMTRACLGQEMAGTAAAGLAMVGRIRAQAERLGERSYRNLLLESGAIAQRVYLSAEAQSLAARNLAAFLDDELNALLRLDGAERAVMHLTMLGRNS